MFKIQNIKKIKFKKTLILMVCILLILSFLFKSFNQSLFFQNKDRVNIVFYGSNTKFYSIGLKDNVNYLLNFFSDLDTVVPGGYGFYRIGALNKLISLEKTPDLFKKTFSANTASFVDYYFYPVKPDIYYGREEKKDNTFPGFSDIFINQSNAHFFDKLYIYLYLTAKHEDDYKILKYDFENKNNNLMFDRDSFLKKYQSFFYKRQYRDERKSAQIIYTNSYNTAFTLSQIVEGEGIKVVDISKGANFVRSCRVIEDVASFSNTSKAIANFFKCSLKKGKTEISDIILELGEKEKEWETN